MITFPTTTEAFIAYQEAGTGRKLEGFERDLAAVVVKLINTSYPRTVGRPSDRLCGHLLPTASHPK